jgi:hypothetical protein
MPKVDPNDEKHNGSGAKTPQCGEGRKLLACVGFERYTAGTGTPMIGARFVCLKDYEGNGDEKAIAYENFTNTEKAMFRLVNFARSAGHHEPFDSDDDDDLKAVLEAGYVEAELITETWNGKDRIKVREFSEPGSIEEDPEWGAWIEEAEAGHQDYLAWREENPRGGGNSGRQGKSGRNARTSSSSGEERGRQGADRGRRENPDDDIPF